MKMNSVECDMPELVTVQELDELEMMASDMLEYDDEQVHILKKLVKWIVTVPVCHSAAAIKPKSMTLTWTMDMTPA